MDFKVSEALAADPVVRVEGRQLSVDEAGTDRAALAYRYSTEVAGNEPQGQPVPVTVDLVDVSGNSAAGLSAGNALFDFTPPSLVTASEVSPAVASAGAEVQVTFALSEALGADPVVTMAAAERQPRAWTLSGKDASGAYTYRYVPTGDEAQGPWQVFAVATDLAGNTSAALALGTAVLDFQAPQVVSAVSIPSRRWRARARSSRSR